MTKRLPLTDADGEVRELTEEDFRVAIPFSALPDSLQTKLRAIQRGRPKAAVTKERITIRLSPDVVQSFRATGGGWQTRIDAALRDWLKSHSPA
ncbi:MAG: BrnA antitoxin family protein [Pseudomonadota bacterium]|nr:BrnA antitoxin family protein [Pseudomonadota bacterium]MDP1905238.1 BrnA antitoxin family protein [Pseudomonadota bacterium]MDP2352800.1 BrnA antitoxin family protein [Pseudomonadota bacterium]